MSRIFYKEVDHCGECPANYEGDWCNLIEDHVRVYGEDFPANCPLLEEQYHRIQ
jgi:hypothetical protein